MTLLETMKLPNFKMFYRPPEGPTYYWDEQGMLCGPDGKGVKLTKSLLEGHYAIQCDHSRYFPVGQGSNWHLKCADCLCDLEIVGIREAVKMPDNRPSNLPPSNLGGFVFGTASETKTNVMPCL